MDPELACHASTLIVLERQLMQQPAMVEAISRANNSAEKTGSLLNDTVMEDLAYGYSASCCLAWW